MKSGFVKDHLAAEVACIWTKARLIECKIRAGWNNQAADNLESLLELSDEIKQLVEKWK